MARKNKIALALIALILLLIVFDVGLALFALSGFLIGAGFVFFVRFMRAPKKARKAELAWKPARLLPLAILVLLLASTLLYRTLKIGVPRVSRMNYAYTGTITFVRETSTWAIQDQVTFADEKKIDQLLKKSRGGGNGQVASSVADMMAKAGWQREGVVGATAARYTKTRTQPAKNRLYPIHTTNTLDLPAFRTGGLVSSLQLGASNIQVIAPKYAVSKTYPPIKSRDDCLRDDLETLPLTLNNIEDVPTVRVQLLSRPLQNEWGFAISQVTVWEGLKWLVTLIAGVVGGTFEDEIKKALAPRAQDLLARLGMKAPPSAPTPTTPPLSPSPPTTPTPTPPPAATSTPTPTPSPAPDDQQ